jgi:phosphotransferase system HPr (HPr) family protein
MTAEPLRARVTIPNEQGLHMRPLGEFVKLASRFQSSIFVQKSGRPRINGRSIIELLTLGAEQGTELTLEVSGPDQEEALRALTDFLASLVQWEEANPV